MSVPMKFYKDGFAILKNQMWSFGIEAICYLGVVRLDRLNLPYTYRPWYQSEINFSKYRETAFGAQVEALEGGLSKYLKANENTVYELPCDEVSVYMDGMEFDQVAHWGILNGFTDNNGFGQHVLNLINVTEEAFDAIKATNTDRRHFADNDDLSNNSIPFLVNGSKQTDIAFDFDFGVTVNLADGLTQNPTAGSRLYVREFLPDGSVIGHRIASYGYDGPGTTLGSLYQHHRVQGQETITVQPGSRLYLIKVLILDTAIAQGSGADQVVQWVYDDATTDFIKANYTYTHPPSNAKGVYLNTLAEMLVDKMTKGQYTFRSNWLKIKKDIVVTSGDALRSIDGAVIKISFSKFFQSLFSRWSVGCGIENDVLVIEPLAYFYQNAVMFDLGEVSDAEITPAEDIIFNTIKAGYEKQDYSDVNGKYETNQGQVWTTPITKIVKEFDFTSPIRSDAFGIELLRINYDQKKTTDSSSDNDSFFLNVKDASITFNATVAFEDSFELFLFPINNAVIIAGNNDKIEEFKKGAKFSVAGSVANAQQLTVLADAVPVSADAMLFTVEQALTDEADVAGIITIQKNILNRPAYTSVTGIPHPDSAFNLELTPHKGLLENGAFIHSIMHKLDGEKIILESADKNKDLVTTLNGVTVTEKEDIAIGNLPAALWLPYYISLKAKAQTSFIEMMKVNPYGKVKFTWNNRQWYAFLEDGGLNPSTLETQTWKVKPSPENDLSKFNS